MRVTFFIVYFLFSNICSAFASGKGSSGHRYRRSFISKYVEKVLQKLKGEGDNVGKKCFAKIEKGEIPSADQKDSPLTSFGYPFFDIPTKSVTARPGATLSYIFGERTPVKIGSQDYIIAGRPNELLAFFGCFENYKVIGSSLNDEGHWIPDTGSIKIQVQNLYDKQTKLTSSAFDLLFKYSMDRIIKYLNPVKIIKGLDAQIMGGSEAAKDVDNFIKLMDHVKQWLPGSETLVDKIIEIFQKPTSLQSKVKELINFIKEEEKKKTALRNQWIGWDNVFKKYTIAVSLTMYAKPEHGVRSTFYTGKSTINMGDIGNAIKLFLEKKKTL